MYRARISVQSNLICPIERWAPVQEGLWLLPINTTPLVNFQMVYICSSRPRKDPEIVSKIAQLAISCLSTTMATRLIMCWKIIDHFKSV
jgi:hypothetical protein